MLVILARLDVLAQPKTWSLRECCNYAVEHNISIKQQQNQCRQQELNLSTAKNSRLPDLSGSVGQNFSFGRGLTAENTYSNTNTSSTSFSLGTSIPLFTGFQIPNQIKLNQLNLEAATADLEKAKNDIRMQVAQAYVQILYDMEIADVARRQIAIDSAQVVRLEAFVSNGKASEAELSQQRATLANSRLTATQADNNYRLSILTLTQLLELPSPEGFRIIRDLRKFRLIRPLPRRHLRRSPRHQARDRSPATAPEGYGAQHQDRPGWESSDVVAERWPRHQLLHHLWLPL